MVTKADRETAGAAYVEALETFKEAYVELCAIERLLGDCEGGRFGAEIGHIDFIPLRHLKFAPCAEVASLPDMVAARVIELSR